MHRLNLDDCPDVMNVDELRRFLRVGKATAYSLAAKIGVRIQSRRIVVPKVAVQRYLTSQSHPGSAVE